MSDRFDSDGAGLHTSSRLTSVGITGGLAAGGAALGAGLSIAQASARNSALDRSSASVRNAARVGYAQTYQQEAIARLKNIRESRRAQGLLRVIAAERTGDSGAYRALSMQAAFDSEVDDWIIQTNTQHQIAAIRSRAEAALTELAGQAVNPILAGLTGALGGAQSGLSIASAFPANPATATAGAVGPSAAPTVGPFLSTPAFPIGVSPYGFGVLP